MLELSSSEIIRLHQEKVKMISYNLSRILQDHKDHIINASTRTVYKQLHWAQDVFNRVSKYRYGGDCEAIEKDLLSTLEKMENLVDRGYNPRDD